MLASKGARVINISYSLYFSSAASQLQMARALEMLTKKYNILVVFSAGNNGPGLGSFNRSAIYPANTLTAGAFVSKELDAHVHGVSGLPEEGRIIYYSSRGPGANFGAGPSVIAPLASLTHSSPTSGFRAFSGTSSAAPALAGFATVLISAIQQSELPLEIGTLVSAIKLSGKKLNNVPYVFQGMGLPQINDAFLIYKSLIKGDLIEKVTPVLSGGEANDGIPAGGLLFKRSELRKKHQSLVNLIVFLQQCVLACLDLQVQEHVSLEKPEIR